MGTDNEYQKTKLLVAGEKSEDEQESLPIIIQGEVIQVVSDLNTWAQL